MVTVNIFHDLRRKKKNDLYPVKLKVTYERRSNELEAKANTIIKTTRPFNFPVFEEKFRQKTYDGTYVETLYNEYIDKLTAQGRIGTADNYKRSINSLLTFKRNLRFEDVNDVFLYRYEQWMLEKNLSITTVGIYLRCLRAIFNEAIYRKIISQEYYPFGKRKYLMPTGKNTKKALPLSDISKIYYYQPENERGYEAKARDFYCSNDVYFPLLQNGNLIASSANQYY